MSFFSNLYLSGSEFWLVGAIVIVYGIYAEVQRRANPFLLVNGPESKNWIGGNLASVLEPGRSPSSHEQFVKQYGRNVRIKGIHPWDERLLPMDLVSVNHVMKNSLVYEKPWQSRRIITGLIGCGLLASEGIQHKRQRRVISPGFSIQNLKEFVPLALLKGQQLSDKWMEMIGEKENNERADPEPIEDGKTEAGKDRVGKGSIVLDVCHWISRATFDVIGLAGFDYRFNAIQDETNELFCAYKDMFEVAVSQGQTLKSVFAVYFPWINWLFPDESSRAVEDGQSTIRRVAMRLIQEKQRKILEGKRTGKTYEAKDMLTLLLKSNASTDIAPEQRISDEDILHNINTFMFAGSDTTSLALTWTLLLLAKHPHIQDHLRAELLSLRPSAPHSALTEEEVTSLWDNVNDLQTLENVCKESLRLIPPVHSSLRVAVKDDIVPVGEPMKLRDGRIVNEIVVPKGTFVHVPIEGMNLDRGYWGQDAWHFKPDRWDNLPEAIKGLPGIYNNTLTFSSGPRACIGMRFSMIEMKFFLYQLLTDFVFTEVPGVKVTKANVVLTRPYVAGKFKDGSQCPLVVTPLRKEPSITPSSDPV